MIPKYDPEYMGLLWYLDHINELELGKLQAEIRNLEHRLNIQRIRTPHIRVPRSGEQPHIRCDDGDGFCLIGDLWEDSIDVAAKHVLKSYRDLPAFISAEDSVYRMEGTEMHRSYIWQVGCYGVQVDQVVAGSAVFSSAAAVRKASSSLVRVHNQMNAKVEPEVYVVTVPLIVGK